jgi:hypothetical protein
MKLPPKNQMQILNALNKYFELEITQAAYCFSATTRFSEFKKTR